MIHPVPSPRSAAETACGVVISHHRTHGQSQCSQLSVCDATRCPTAQSERQKRGWGGARAYLSLVSKKAIVEGKVGEEDFLTISDPFSGRFGSDSQGHGFAFKLCASVSLQSLLLAVPPPSYKTQEKPHYNSKETWREGSMPKEA